MADRNIDQRIRKPRRAKGTPLLYQRNYFACGVLLLSGFSWWLYELWPEARKLKKAQLEGKFKFSPEFEEKIIQMQISQTNASLGNVIEKAKLRKEAKENNEPEEAQPMPCPINTQPISKYFMKTDEQPQEFNENLCETPYKASLKEINNVSYDDSNDFDVSKPLIKNVIKKTKCKSKNVSKKKCKKQPTIFKILEENYRHEDVDSEHLQMALALSLSSCTSDEQSTPDIDVEDVYFPSAQEKGTNIKQTLEKFGFKSDKPTLNLENCRTIKHKKYKRHFKPFLLLQSEEERQKIITNKISLILSEQNTNNEKFNNKSTLFSNLLQNYKSATNGIFSMNILDLSKLDDAAFYKGNLNIRSNRFGYGKLLKNWHEIPGREITPPRKIKTLTTASCSKESLLKLESNEENFSINRAISPDLFDSDESCHNSPVNSNFIKSPAESESNSQSLLSFTKNEISTSDCTIIKSDKGIKHLESFCIDSDSLTQKCFDLTNSSDEETEKLSNFNENFDNLQTDEKITEDRSSNIKNNTINVVIISDDENEQNYNHLNENKKLQSEEKNIHIIKASEGDVEKDSPSITVISDTSDSENELDANQLEKNNEELCNNENEIITENRNEKLRASFFAIINSELQNLENSTKCDTHEIELNLSSHNKHTPKKNLTASPNSFAENSFFTNSQPNKLNTSINSELECLNLENKHETVEEKVEKEDVMDLTNFSDSSNHEDLECIATVSKQEFPDGISPKNFDTTNKSLNITAYINELLNKSKLSFIEENNEEIASRRNKISSRRRIEMISDSESDEENNKNELPQNCDDLLLSDESIYISDEELNCCSSMHVDEAEETESENEDNEITPKKCTQEINNRILENIHDEFKMLQHPQVQLLKNIDKTPETHKNEENKTPDGGVLIKTENLTPSPNYTIMNSPQIQKELQKYGLKPLKRRRGVQILKYIYETTHPLVMQEEESSGSEIEDCPSIKRVKKCDERNLINENLKSHFLHANNAPLIVGDLLTSNDSFEELIFERKQSSKVASCRIPLHIAWHNLVTSNAILQENILLYEPLQLEVLYMMLKDQGFNFHIHDLLTFLDKKCITVRIAQNEKQNRNRKKITTKISN